MNSVTDSQLLRSFVAATESYFGACQVTFTDTASPHSADSASVALDGAFAPGLVSYKTSRTDQNNQIVTKLDNGDLLIDRQLLRLKKMKQSVITSARLITEELKQQNIRYQPWMITLTYKTGVKWQPYQVTKALDCCKKWLLRKNKQYRFYYVGVAEIQEKRKQKEGGHCVHYHIIIWIPKHLSIPKFDKQSWWPYGFTQREKAIAPISYITKYASKGSETSSLPKGCRISLSGGLSAENRQIRAWWRLPLYVREIWASHTFLVKRAQGGGFTSALTGEYHPSRYHVV